MATKSVTVECSKETLEALQNSAEFVKATRQALADGWQLGQDLPVLMTAALTQLVPALSALDNVKDELAENRKAFERAVALGSADLVDAFLPPAAAPAPTP